MKKIQPCNGYFSAEIFIWDQINFLYEINFTFVQMENDIPQITTAVTAYIALLTKDNNCEGYVTFGFSSAPIIRQQLGIRQILSPLNNYLYPFQSSVN